jgi:small-conductance mechanosensitive channel
MELTLEGATLMAGLYPVGIVVAALEVRAMSGVARIRLRGGIYNRASAFVVVASAFPAAMAIPVLVSSVATGITLKGWLVGTVAVAGWMLWVGVISLLIELAVLARKLDTSTGGIGRLGESEGESDHGSQGSGRGRRTRKCETRRNQSSPTADD